MRFKPTQQWTMWFAWHPVIITEGSEYASIVWLECVYRKRTSFKYPWEYMAA